MEEHSVGYQKYLKSKKIAGVLKVTGIITLVIALLLSPFWTHKKTYEREIPFRQYSQTLSKGTNCYIDITAVEYYTSLWIKGGVHVTGATYLYYVVEDIEGNKGIVALEESQNDEFVRKINEASSSLKIYGNIIETPSDIMSLEEDDAASTEEFLSQYKTMKYSSNVEMSEVVTESQPGIGLIPLVMAIVLLVVSGYINKEFVKSSVYSVVEQMKNEMQQKSQNEEKMITQGGWTCECGRVNPAYTGTCACGKRKN